METVTYCFTQDVSLCACHTSALLKNVSLESLVLEDLQLSTDSHRSAWKEIAAAISTLPRLTHLNISCEDRGDGAKPTKSSIETEDGNLGILLVKP